MQTPAVVTAPVEITGYKGAYGASVIVPATINGQKVVGVADLVAYDTGLTSIIVSEALNTSAHMRLVGCRVKARGPVLYFPPL